jgi:hypothetical protein
MSFESLNSLAEHQTLSQGGHQTRIRLCHLSSLLDKSGTICDVGRVEGKIRERWREGENDFRGRLLGYITCETHTRVSLVVLSFIETHKTRERDDLVGSCLLHVVSL